MSELFDGVLRALHLAPTTSDWTVDTYGRVLRPFCHWEITRTIDVPVFIMILAVVPQVGLGVHASVEFVIPDAVFCCCANLELARPPVEPLFKDMLLSFTIFAIGWVVLQQPVVGIEVRGNLHIPEEPVIAYVGSLREKAPGPAELREAFRHLWDTGFFEDIRFGTEEVPGGVRLIVEVDEKPLLRSVSIRGETATEADLVDELRGRGIDLRPGRPFSESDAAEAARTLDSLLGDSFRVSVELDLAEGHRVDLVLEVERRVVVRIARTNSRETARSTTIHSARSCDFGLRTGRAGSRAGTACARRSSTPTSSESAISIGARDTCAPAWGPRCSRRSRPKGRRS